MKKKFYSIACLCGLIIVLFCLFAKQDNTSGTAIFQATVIKADTNSILVKPVEGYSEFHSSDQFHIPNGEQLVLQAGDLLEITYDGEIAESYPAQLGKVYKIVLVD